MLYVCSFVVSGCAAGWFSVGYRADLRFFALAVAASCCVFCLWQVWHTACRLSLWWVPPVAMLCLWSTSVAVVVHPGFCSWQVWLSRLRISFLSLVGTCFLRPFPQLCATCPPLGMKKSPSVEGDRGHACRRVDYSSGFVIGSSWLVVFWFFGRFRGLRLVCIGFCLGCLWCCLFFLFLSSLRGLGGLPCSLWLLVC